MNLPILVRLDDGNDAADNVNLLLDQEADFIIKRNPRKELPEQWLDFAKYDGRHIEMRVGKDIYLGSIVVQPERFI
ncbi:hypothetical protein GOM71_16595 [Paenibacillus sp. NEAU-GSW1]|nr:hypothetical protein [Paenibacillus sp. NEAU-GSW1]